MNVFFGAAKKLGRFFEALPLPNKMFEVEEVNNAPISLAEWEHCHSVSSPGTEGAAISATCRL
jgi:hypothetical protein